MPGGGNRVSLLGAKKREAPKIGKKGIESPTPRSQYILCGGFQKPEASKDGKGPGLKLSSRHRSLEFARLGQMGNQNRFFHRKKTQTILEHIPNIPNLMSL